jgi:hypothetical protein
MLWTGLCFFKHQGHLLEILFEKSSVWKKRAEVGLFVQVTASRQWADKISLILMNWIKHYNKKTIMH